MSTTQVSIAQKAIRSQIGVGTYVRVRNASEALLVIAVLMKEGYAWFHPLAVAVAASAWELEEQYIGIDEDKELTAFEWTDRVVPLTTRELPLSDIKMLAELI